MDMKQFEKGLKILKANGEKMDTMFHEHAMFALEQINQHGNNGPVNKLLGSINKATRKEALYVWFNDFGLTKRNKDNTIEYRGTKKLYSEGEVITTEQALILADESPFYDYTKEVAPASSYDALQAMKALLKRAKAKKADGLTVEHPEVLEYLAAFPGLSAE